MGKLFYLMYSNDKELNPAPCSRVNKSLITGKVLRLRLTHSMIMDGFLGFGGTLMLMRGWRFFVSRTLMHFGIISHDTLQYSKPSPDLTAHVIAGLCFPSLSCQKFTSIEVSKICSPCAHFWGMISCNFCSSPTKWWPMLVATDRLIKQSVSPWQAQVKATCELHLISDMSCFQGHDRIKYHHLGQQLSNLHAHLLFCY